MQIKQPEVWQRGPVQGVPPLLQPVAHALLQAEDEIAEAVTNLTPNLLWQRPAGVACIAFHVQHITGVLNRLFAYARGEQLTIAQLEYLKKEGVEGEGITAQVLLDGLSNQIQLAIAQLQQTSETELVEKRGIGRKQIPTTVMGLLFHAAEHTMRHTGQLLVTVKVLTMGNALSHTA
jgi:uncharacterized damage-inducible protein DinB